jgi:cobyrinic acid a,c-diamide synthase
MMVARLVIAGTQSGVGKTTLTVGIIAALRRRGLTVQPFKVGPDYIDPTYHSLAAGRPCRNLDTWLVPPERVRALFEHAASAANVAIIEGVMGLFDGAGYGDDAGSTAEVAKLLGAPVVVVMDAAKMARSVGAIAIGYQRFDDELLIRGFVLNRVAGDEHGRGAASAVTKATDLPVLGWVPRAEALQVPERHLGLVPTNEPGRWREFTDSAADAVTRHLNMDRLLDILRQDDGGKMKDEKTTNSFGSSLFVKSSTFTQHPRIAVARDKAFQFLYEDNLDLLNAAGAEIVFFSPLRDTALPPGTSGVILSGGFPEIYAERLATNRALHAAVHAAHEHGLPIYAECGGLMYLTSAIIDGDGRRHEMVGLLPGHCEMSRELTMGYRQAQSAGRSWFLSDGEKVRGHEFHYSTWKDRPEDLAPAFLLLPRSGTGAARPEGARVGNLWASYVHLHFAAKPELAQRFIEACARVPANPIAPIGPITPVSLMRGKPRRSFGIGFFAALQFLTIVPPVVRRPFTELELGRAVGWFGLVGTLLGFALAGADYALGLVFPDSARAALVLAMWVLLTGALHLDGFLDTCDGLFGGRTPDERLRIMRDERVGAFAVIGGVLLLLVKYACLTALAVRWAALLVAVTVARGGLALAIFAFPYARADGAGRWMKDHTVAGEWISTPITDLSAPQRLGVISISRTGPVAQGRWMRNCRLQSMALSISRS